MLHIISSTKIKKLYWFWSLLIWTETYVYIADRLFQFDFLTPKEQKIQALLPYFVSSHEVFKEFKEKRKSLPLEGM